MLKKVSFVLAVMVLLAPTALSYAAPSSYEGRVIVIFNEAVDEDAQDAIVEDVGGAEVRSLPLINGKALELPSKEAEEALKGKGKRKVLRVEKDDYVYALDSRSEKDGKSMAVKTASQPAQTMEWNVDKIDADLAWATSRGATVKVGILDTGIDRDHPDLVGNIKGGRNYVRIRNKLDPTKWDDDNGHGTHVAGIVAALDNEIGVLGTAPQADLYAIKVLNRFGGGYISDIVAGIGWAVQNNIDVLNMSIGWSTEYQTVRDAIAAADAAGVVLVAAAGNSGDTNPDNDLSYPAKYSQVIAVAATDSNNVRAAWSSDGAEVEIAAPGVSVRSTYKGDTYAIMSGTSMATPHVVGTAALILASPVRAAYDTNLNGLWDSSEVRAALTSTTDDLGAVGRDTYYGFGLVDAEESVTGVQTN